MDRQINRGGRPAWRDQIDRRRWLAIAAGTALFRGIPLVAGESPLSTAASRYIFEDRQKKNHEITARVMVEAQDGGLLLQGVDGRLWQVPPERQLKREEVDAPFTPLTGEELGRQVVQEMGPGFQSLVSERYVLCTNASEPYAKWCAALLERLATAFRAYWKQRGFPTIDPPFPLVAIVFQRQTQFAEFATVDAGPDVATVPGYFSIPTNRIVLRDLTESSRGQPVRSAEEIEQRLGTAQYNVATMIHEATHQIAFNSGLHTRLADNPLWLTEGMATFFETPDLRSKTGWNTAGKVNRPRLQRFKEFLAQRRATDSLETLVKNDVRMTNSETAEDAYAESWALTYFLMRKEAAAYVKYLTQISRKEPLEQATMDQRLTEFQAAFGDLRRLDTEFVRYVKPLR